MIIILIIFIEEVFIVSADLYVFNEQTVQGYRGVNINTRDNIAVVSRSYSTYIDTFLEVLT